jgi:hypothetical protein
MFLTSRAQREVLQAEVEEVMEEEEENEVDKQRRSSREDMIPRIRRAFNLSSRLKSIAGIFLKSCMKKVWTLGNCGLPQLRKAVLARGRLRCSNSAALLGWESSSVHFPNAYKNSKTSLRAHQCRITTSKESK